MDLRKLRTAPVLFAALEQNVLARAPFLHAIRTCAERGTVVVSGLVDVAPGEDVTRERAADELQLVGCVNLAVVHHGRKRVRRVDPGDAVEAICTLGFPVSLVDGVDRELDVGRRVCNAVVPAHARPQLPRDIHPAVRSHTHAAVGKRRHLSCQHGHDVHALVVRHEPFDHAGLDILENVRRIAIHRVGLAIVPDNQQVIRRRQRRSPTREARQEQDEPEAERQYALRNSAPPTRDRTDEAHVIVPAWRRASDTGMDPHPSSAS